jgi:hypothetical protein
MKKKWLLFILGIIILIISIPMSTQMTLELIHNQKMDNHYKITNVSADYPPKGTTFEFKDQLIEIEETILDEEGYKDPWDNQIVFADLSLKLNGIEIETMKNHPIRIGGEGLQRYYGEISYLLLEDKENDKKQLIVLLKKTRELQKEMPNGNIIGGVPEEKLKFKLYELDEKGKLNIQTFSFTERNALQTELLNASGLSPYSIGYYTDAWEWYPTIVFPFLFPFLSLLLGLALIAVYAPFNRKK